MRRRDYNVKCVRFSRTEYLARVFIKNCKEVYFLRCSEQEGIRQATNVEVERAKTNAYFVDFGVLPPTIRALIAGWVVADKTERKAIEEQLPIDFSADAEGVGDIES